MAQSGYMNNYQLYPASYFTGADVYLSMNGQVLDDVCFLEFEMTENLMPVYGYSSYVYDAVAHGSRLVQGRFGINFQTSGKIPAMLANTATEIATKSPQTKPYAGLPASMSQTETINWIKGRPKDQIKDLAESLEDQIWGAASTTSQVEAKIGDKEDNPFFTPLSSILHQRGFDIVAMFGREGLGSGVGTVVTLNQCHIYGQSQKIAAEGGYIIEMYQFIARDMNNTVKAVGGSK